jgi:hypothetical protein
LKSQPTFRRNMSPPSSASKNKPSKANSAYFFPRCTFNIFCIQYRFSKWVRNGLGCAYVTIDATNNMCYVTWEVWCVLGRDHHNIHVLWGPPKRGYYKQTANCRPTSLLVLAFICPSICASLLHSSLYPSVRCLSVQNVRIRCLIASHYFHVAWHSYKTRIVCFITKSIYLWLHSPCGPRSLFQFLNLYTVGRTPWTGDQPVATHTEKSHSDIHASSGIRTHDPSVRAGEDSLCLRRRGRCDRLSTC